MSYKSLDFITHLQKFPSNIRNICILAHVDHGKTSLADSLIASNGIISTRLAGKLRYMDSREDEQKRGITMKSSAISLMYNLKKQNYLINLIDSPGHIDFSSEVSTAVRICDGALVVVDVVEGVCPQTNAVLRQAWLEGIKPCLVLNKIDRLIVELKMSPLEAYFHIQKVLEQVNAVTGLLFSQHVMESSSQQNTEEINEKNESEDTEQVFDWSSGLDEADDDDLYFSPSQGNVIFASAVDGWAFRIDKFAKLYSEKLGISQKILLKTLWGDYYLNMKAKRILKGAYTKGKKPLFVQFILDNLFNVYDAVLINRHKEKITKITTALNLKISLQDSKYTQDVRSHLHAILRQWLPLADAVLEMVVQQLPSPVNISDERIKNLMCGRFKSFEAYNKDTVELKADFHKCSSLEEAPVIVFVSKMLSITKDMLPQNKRRPLTQEELSQRHEEAKKRLLQKQQERSENKENNQQQESEEPNNISEINNINTKEVKEENQEECFVAFARIFSGTLKKGAKVYVLGPKYDPSTKKEIEADIGSLENAKEVTRESFNSSLYESINQNHVSTCTVTNLYVMMGRELDEVEQVPAGNILGINGLSNHVLKSATLSTTLSCPPFTPMPLEARPIVRVAVEPKYPTQIPKLVQGMKLLNQSDPCVQVLLQESGEYVVVAAGEVHLQRCLDDLSKQYAKIEIKASDPIVSFRETIVKPPKIDMVNEEIGNINKNIAHHTQRLPNFMLKEIQAFSETIKKGNEQEIGEEDITSKESKKTSKLKEKLGLIEACTSNKKYCLCLHAKPLPQEIVKLLEENLELLKVIQKFQDSFLEDRAAVLNDLTTDTKNKISEFYYKLKSEFEKAGKDWKNILAKIWAFGPKGFNNNILINNTKDYKRPSIWVGLHELENKNAESTTVKEFDNSITQGFHIATQAGPICEEPVMGVAFFIEEWKILDEYTKDNTAISYGPVSGQLISTVKEGCRRAIMAQPMRLIAPMYSCEIQATSEVLGKLYAVLGKREGKVLSEDMKEGSDIFIIKAQMPVAESFGFAEDIRKKTSGLASPQLVFSHWETLDIDPFWIPTTEEEYELYGEKADSENQALKYVNLVRKRKGLYVEEKTVEHAEKQRTLKKNK